MKTSMVTTGDQVTGGFKLRDSNGISHFMTISGLWVPFAVHYSPPGSFRTFVRSSGVL